MYRGNFTGAELLVKIQEVKTATSGKFKVGTADSWNKYQDGTADPLIKGGADILLTHSHTGKARLSPTLVVVSSMISCKLLVTFKPFRDLRPPQSCGLERLVRRIDPCESRARV